MSYKLRFAPAFKLSLQRLSDFLNRKFGRKVSEKARTNIREKVILLAKQPELGPICQRLLDLGVAGYRQLVVDEHNMVIYRVDASAKEVNVLLVFDTRQSLQKLLTDFQLAL